MALTYRQYWILRAFYKNEGKFIKTSSLANSLHCTHRSIQNDLIALRRIAKQEPSFLLDTRKASGTRIIIFDSDGFQRYLDAQSDLSLQRMNNREYRIRELFRILAASASAVSIQQLGNAAFSSPSTIRSDLRALSSLIARYHLSLSIERGYAALEGTEIARRQAIFYLCLDPEKQNASLPGLWQNRSRFSSLLRTTIKSEHMAIADYYLDRAIHLFLISISRIADGFLLNKDDGSRFHSSQQAVRISKTLFDGAIDLWNLTIPDPEISFFAFLIQNIITSSDESSSDQKTVKPSGASTPWINNALEQISRIFPVSLTEDTEIIQQLETCIPSLREQIQADIEQPEDLDEFVTIHNPMSIDMAVMFAMHMQTVTGLRPSPHAICKLSLFFQDSLRRHGLIRKKIGLISALPVTEKILLRELLYREFGRRIETIDFLPAPQTGYDCLLSTEQETATNHPSVSLIIYPPDHRQLEQIHYRITGYTPDHVLNLFSPKLFFTADIDDRNMAEIYLISETARLTSNCELPDAIQKRDTFLPNYYENGVAILKPLSPFPGKSCASIMLLKNGIAWETGHTVSLLILLSVSPKDQSTMLACNDFGPALFEAEWRQLLNGSDSFSDLMNLFRARLSRSLFESGMPNLKPDPWKEKSI